MFQQIFLENLLIFFLGYDFIVKVLVAYFQFNYLYNYVIVFKAVIVGIVVFIYGFPKKKIKLYLALLLISISFAITQGSSYGFLDVVDTKFNGYYYLSSVTPLIFLFFINDYDKEMINIQVHNFLKFIAISSVFALIGYLLNIDVFRSYFRGDRFGYSGFLLYHHEIGYIIFIAINLAYLKYKRQKNYINALVFLIIFFGSFLFGTKKTVFLTIIFIIYYVVDNLKKPKAILSSILTSLFLGIFFYKILKQILLDYYTRFHRIYIEKGFWSSFLSYRNDLFFDRWLPYVNSENNILNIIFGWPLFRGHRSELEFFDLFLFFGLAGMTCYILVFGIVLKRQKKEAYYIVFSLLFASLFSGNLLTSVNVMILIFFALKYINIQKV